MDYLTIGDFGRASGLTAKALRLYDDLGLLQPADVDPWTGYRRYLPEQLDQARVVARLRLVGMPLARIGEVIATSGRTRAAEVSSYWSQVEADHRARRDVVASLVRELDHEEITMTDQHPHETLIATAAARHGRGARTHQLDAVHVGARLFAVADGFGAAPGPGAAAIAALTTLDTTSYDDGPAAARDLLGDAVTRASTAVAEATQDLDEEAGTTLTALWLVGNTAQVAHVGDARAHRLRDGKLERLTRDHTLVQALLEEGRLTEDEARSHPHRALLNRVLVQATDADRVSCDVRAGDRLVLTTDGVHSTLDPDELTRLLTGSGDPDVVADRVARAVEAAEAPDNYTVVVVDLST
ncbi:hypothetical protein NPS01_09790 [Nocardioides psychrotolerans]|uniref:Serine/threonine protein phosphatase PrpC n=1 Tax=Nocardioides psychrotolerans TaxID=1005945 RepID=A0A1I3FUB4_9ACTN|nr:MerR family transcriptional regulator [Nocardioides psychrotolerans]GEP37316.1 hypothetical protein NPS01_09790 [Nocardioides psychrotolerans]SFI14858.1 Serine/threonine protein phosphatase PrpC [Nocardioides psychrotolerans]